MQSSDDEVMPPTRRVRSTMSYAESSDDEDDIPLSLTKDERPSPGTSDTSVSSSEAKKKRPKVEDSDDEELPKKARKVAKKPAVKNKKKDTKKPAVKKEKKETKRPAVKKERKETKVKKETKETKVKKETVTETKQVKDDKDALAEAEEDENYKWWEREDLNDEIKWTTLEHNGVLFPPPYKPLPKRVKLLYNGEGVELPPEAEEVAGFFGAMLESDHAKHPVFQKNFFKDFLEVLKSSGGTKNGIEIKDFDKCDFTKIQAYYDKQREEKKNMSKEEKKAIKAQKEAEEAPYKFCIIDGRKEQVGNFRIEPPGLFRGRGSHPKTGLLKKRVTPEEVTINIGKEAKVPEPPKGHQWAEVKHDNTGAWLAMWKENVLGNQKYVRLAANSSLKGISDYKKYEKARQLKDYIDTIRRDYQQNFKSKLMLERQMAVATYLIDVFALRAGGEKSEDLADTVGCCSLRYEHVTLKPPNTVIFDFLGKDSIRFYKEVEVDPQVFKNLKIFKKDPKTVGDQLFDRIDPSVLNKHLQNYMPGLTAKVFRTYNASKTMQDLLKKIPNEGTVAEKLVKFNAANREVAILCNHQRTITKGHAASVQKINEKIREMQWQKIRLKRVIAAADKKLVKKKPEYFSELEMFSVTEEIEIVEGYIEKEKEKVNKKFVRDNEKLKSEGKPLLEKSELKEKLKKVEENKKELIKEAKSRKVSKETQESADIEKLEKNVEKLEERISNTSLQLKDKEDNAAVALGTSKINYIDPRLSVVFSKKYNVPIEKLFTKTLRDKFKWAIESADEDWEF